MVHGHTVNNAKSSTYKTWQNMKQRCYYPKHEKFKFYGGLGIRVCEQWRTSFTTFLADMGEKPTRKHSIDRIDPDKDYQPDNCRWLLLSKNRLRAKRG